MRTSVVAVILSVLCCAGSADSVCAQLPEIEPLTSVRIMTDGTVHQGSWIMANDSAAVLQREGIRRNIPLAGLDSIQHWVQSKKTSRDLAIIGAVFVGAFAVTTAGGMCDIDCGWPIALFGGAGAALGGLAGSIIGSFISSARGRWVTIYRRS